MLCNLDVQFDSQPHDQQSARALRIVINVEVSGCSSLCESMAQTRVALGLLLLLAAAHAFDDEMKELAAMVREQCASETGVDLSLVDKVNAGADLTSLTDNVFKCYIKCVLETAGMFSEGKVDVEAVLAMLPDDLRKKNEASIQSCGTKKGSDDCDTAYLTQVCWQGANKADYFLI